MVKRFVVHASRSVEWRRPLLTFRRDSIRRGNVFSQAPPITAKRSYATPLIGWFGAELEKKELPKMSALLSRLHWTGHWTKPTQTQPHARRFGYFGLALIAVGVIGLVSLAISPPTTVTLAILLFLGGVIEAGAGLANLGRKDALMHVLTGVLAIEAGFIFRWLPTDAMVPLTVVITALLTLGGVFRFTVWLKHNSETNAAAPISAAVDLILAVLIWVAWPQSVFWVLALALTISQVFRGIHWLGYTSSRFQRPPSRHSEGSMFG